MRIEAVGVQPNQSAGHQVPIYHHQHPDALSTHPTKCDNLVSSEERRLLSLTYAKYRSYASQQHSSAVSYGCVSSTQRQRFSLYPFSGWTGMLIAERVKVTDKYTIIGFISSGTYGRVFKAKSRLVLFSFSWERVLMVDGMEESLRSRSLSRIRRG